MVFQALLWFNAYYVVAFAAVFIATFVWKSQVLPYPPRAWGAEFFLIWVQLPLEASRTFVGPWPTGRGGVRRPHKVTPAGRRQACTAT